MNFFFLHDNALAYDILYHKTFRNLIIKNFSWTFDIRINEVQKYFRT